MKPYHENGTVFIPNSFFDSYAHLPTKQYLGYMRLARLFGRDTIKAACTLEELATILRCSKTYVAKILQALTTAHLIDATKTINQWTQKAQWEISLIDLPEVSNG